MGAGWATGDESPDRRAPLGDGVKEEVGGGSEADGLGWAGEGAGVAVRAVEATLVVGVGEVVEVTAAAGSVELAVGPAEGWPSTDVTAEGTASEESVRVAPCG